MFAHILIPTDLSDRARSAIDLTTRLVHDRPTRVTLLHVVEEIAQARRDEFKDFYENLEKRSAQKLDELARLAERPGTQIERQVVYGSPAAEIIKFAAQHDVDLIVLASHPVDPARPERGWGTLSYRVSMLAPCPVLLVK